MADLNNSTKEKPSQKELFGKTFLEMRPDVTADDRNKCAKHVGISRRTVDGYVNGHVWDITTGVKVLNFLKKQIANRAKKHLGED